MKYGINLTWNDLKQDEGALALVREYLPAMEIRAALQNRQQDIHDHIPTAHHADLFRIGEDKEQDQERSKGHADIRPGYDALFAAMLADVFCAECCKEQRRNHADDAQNGRNAHVANHDAAEQGVDNSLTADLLCNFIGCSCSNITLQRLISFQNIEHSLQIQRLVLGSAFKGFRFIVSGDANSRQQIADGTNNQDDTDGGGKKSLIVSATADGQKHNIQNDGKNSGNKVIECDRPHTNGRTLLGVIRQNRVDGLHSHVVDGVADHIQQIQDGKDRKAEPIAGHAIKHEPKGESLNEVADPQQNTDFAEARINAVIDESDHRVGDGINDPRAGQNDADNGSCDAVTNAGGITRMPMSE